MNSVYYFLAQLLWKNVIENSSIRTNFTYWSPKSIQIEFVPKVFSPKLCDPLLSPLISIETRVIVAFFIVFANVYKTAQDFLKVSLSPPAEISTVTVFFLDFLIQHCNITPVIKLDNFEIYFLLGWWLVAMFLVSYFFFICRKVWIILSEIWDFEMFAPCISWGVFVDVNSVWGQVINSQHYKRGKGIKNVKHDEQKKEF